MYNQSYGKIKDSTEYTFTDGYALPKDNDGMYMEEEFGKVIDPPKGNLYRPVISEAVKKIVILNGQKQKLHGMKQQILNEEQKRKEQEKLIVKETHGMSM